MGETYSVTAMLSAVDKNFSSVMQKAASQTTSFSDKVKSTMTSVGTAMVTAGTAMGIAGTAITAMGVKSVESFGKFEQEINKAAVIAGGSSKDIKGLSDEAAKLGSTLPISAQDAAAAMTEMARNGASVKDLKNDFPPIARAAASAGEDLSNTATVVQQSMNLWGGGMKNATKYSAILTETANKSNATIGDMQQVLADVGGTATNMGMSLSDVATAAGIMTNSGIPAAQAAQELNHALLAMEAPSNVARKEMEALGLKFSDANGKAKPLPTILREVAKATDGMGDAQKAAALKAMFGTAGMNAMMPLLKSVNGQAKSGNTDWNTFAAALDKAGGSYQKASKYLQGSTDQMQKNVGSQIDQLKDSFTSLSLAANQSSSKGIQQFLIKLQDLLGHLTTSNDKLSVFVRNMIALAPVLGPVLLAFGALTIVIGKVISSAQAIASAFSGIGAVLTSPWGIAIVAIAAAGVALWAFFTKTEQGKAIWQSFSTFLIGLWNAISPALIATWKALSAAFAATWQALVTIIQPIIQSIITIFTQLAPILVPIIQGLGLILVTTFTGIVTGVAGILQVLLTVISGTLTVIATVWSSVWNSMRAVVGTIFTVIGTLISTALQVIIGVIKVALALITGNWRGAWNAIKGIASAVWNGIKAIISSVLSAIKTIISSGINVIKSIWDAGINALKSVVSAVWNTIKSVFSAGVAFIKSAVHVDLGAAGEAIMNSLLNGLKQAWEGVKSFVGGIAGWIKSHKGPISYDRRLLIPHGEAIMLGFNEGLMKQFSNVQSNVSAMAGKLADSMQISMPAIDTTQMDSSLNRLSSLSSAALSGSFNGSVSLEDTTVSQQNNALLRRIADKDTNLYMDSDTLVGTTSDKFNGQLGATSNNDERWGW
ncbi:phage tail tape measure protein [Pediococcus acidilactici]|uniref:phage tail tape measure protein n=1 Tax=Pediococcus acidilactici TaxID=1254 RepID=UPI00200B78BE|nr:phage tail tape measure protein [Pediococcus acidilactici]UPU32299.1 phage tail tape measure protein [Pediococcus acidilactici]